MNNQLNIALAVRLCSADISCGFISVEPVQGNRDELIKQRLAWYREQLATLVFQLPKESNLTVHVLTLAVELTCADILCDAIVMAPVLYDRNEKIIERLLSYFHSLRESCGVIENSGEVICIAGGANLQQDYKTDCGDIA